MATRKKITKKKVTKNETILNFEDYVFSIQTALRSKNEKTLFFSRENWKEKFKFYERCENEWNHYFKKVFIPKFRKNKEEKKITMIFWESCPENKKNYAFSNLKEDLDKKRDSYLITVCNRVAKDSSFYEGSNVCIKKGAVLENLSTEGYLIIDLFPTHGFKIKTANRDYGLSDIIDTYTIPHLNKIVQLLYKKLSGKKINNTIYRLKFLRKKTIEKIRPYARGLKKAIKSKKIIFKSYPEG